MIKQNPPQGQWPSEISIYPVNKKRIIFQYQVSLLDPRGGQPHHYCRPGDIHLGPEVHLPHQEQGQPVDSEGDGGDSGAGDDREIFSDEVRVCP